LAARRGFRCVGTYASVEDALRRLADPAPDVLLLDIRPLAIGAPRLGSLTLV
jgi:hypothetical protein